MGSQLKNIFQSFLWLFCATVTGFIGSMLSWLTKLSFDGLVIILEEAKILHDAKNVYVIFWILLIFLLSLTIQMVMTCVLCIYKSIKCLQHL